jgi:hypothetical protein
MKTLTVMRDQGMKTQREKAEVVLSVPPNGQAGAAAPGKLISAAVAVARAYLALVPADDDEPVDEAWLLSVGCEICGNPIFIGTPTSHPIRAALVTLRDKLPSGVWSHVSTVSDEWQQHLAFATTRGQFRRLCSALGIELSAENKQEPRGKANAIAAGLSANGSGINSGSSATNAESQSPPGL